MDLFGLLSCEDFEDIEQWTCKIENILNVRNHQLCSRYSFDFYSDTPLIRTSDSCGPLTNPLHAEESETEAQTEDYLTLSRLFNVNITRG